MHYYVIGNRVIQTGGGHIIFREDAYDSNHERYMLATEQELTALRECRWMPSMAYKSKW